ncbi:threonine aldolase family protein [Bartonella sp. LJL80]
MIDLRSDTVTQPTDEMRTAMAAVHPHDDTLEGDPVVRSLEEKAAAMLGKQAGLYVSGGTMGNIIASLVHSSGGGEALLDCQAHMALSEAGGISRLAGLYSIRIPSKKGEMDLDILKKSIRAEPSRYGLATAMINVETSHNHSGGFVPSLDYMRNVYDLGQKNDVSIHIDGARLFNAATALGVSAQEIAQYGDSVSICLSKGLSAPMGAVLAGSEKFIETARSFRRMVGGGLRQSAGIMAAAGLIGLETMSKRLAEDHQQAKRIWQGIAEIDAQMVESDAPQTNIFQVHIGHLAESDAAIWCHQLQDCGLLARPASKTTIRLVTHRHIDEKAADEAVAIWQKVFARLKR